MAVRAWEEIGMDGLGTIEHNFELSDAMKKRLSNHYATEHSRQKQREWYKRSRGELCRNSKWNKCYSGREEFEQHETV